MLDLTEEELIGIYLCVIDSDDSSEDEDEDGDGDEESTRRTSTKILVGSKKKHDWKPESWTEDSSERHARIMEWITEVAAQQECKPKKRAAEGPPDNTSTSLTGIKHPSSVAKRRRTSREIPT